MTNLLKKSRSIARARQQGFTLIELLIVLAIMGILAGIIVPNASNMLSTSGMAAANAEIANVQIASVAYYAEKGSWPTDSSSLDGFITGTPKANYSFDQATGFIVGVSAVRWSGIRFLPPPEPYTRNGDWVK